MSLPYKPPKWSDGTYAIPTPVSLPVFSAPVPGVNAEYLLSQKWQILRNYFVGGVISTAHPDYATFFLVGEGPRQEVGPALVEWERLYAQVPALHNEWETFPYSFIGMVQQVGTGNVTRGRTTWKVTTRVQHDYFLLGQNQTDPITGVNYTPATPGDIAKIYANQYSIQATVGGFTYGGVTLATDYLAPSAAVTNPTVPTSEQYIAMVSDAVSHGWSAGKSFTKIKPTTTASYNAGVIDAATVYGGQIVVEDSALSRWLGNIYLRRTRYALAQ